MSTKKKIVISIIVVLALASVVAISVWQNRKEPVVVEQGEVERVDELVAVVSSTGEIKPKEYVELQAEITGVITHLYVEEGDRVDRGSILLHIDPIQTEAEARAQEALLNATRAEARNQLAQISVQKGNLQRDLSSIRVAEAELKSAREKLQLAQRTFDRKQGLFEENLISRDEYELVRNDLVTAETALETAEARLEQAQTQYQASQSTLEQAEASYESAMSRVAQQEAFLERSQDLLAKTTIRSPLEGVITQLNVEVGERAVPGTLNNPAATLMVIADLSVIEAEVEVDETDIVDLALGQAAEVNVDALPDRPIEGLVTEIGNSAIQTASAQEAKDFKVVIQLQDPPAVLRPGLSCTAEITTAIRKDVLTIPIQALTIREFPVDEAGNLVRREKPPSAPSEVEASRKDEDQETKEFEGVFVIDDGRARFMAVETGVMGDTEIEVIEGLSEGMTIVTGSYQTLRTLADDDPVEVESDD